MKFGSIFLATLAAFITLNALAGDPSITSTNKYPWDGSVSAGLTLTKGNSDTLLFTLKALADKKEPVNEYHLGADFTYGESDSKRTADSVHGFAQWNHTFTDDFYGYARVEGLRDDIAGIKYRFTIGPGVGYYFIKDTQTTLAVEGGGSYVFQRLGTNDTSYMTLRLAQRFEHKFATHGARVWETVEILPQVDRIQNYLVNAEVGVEAAISKSFTLQVYVDDNYDSEPAPGRKKNDIKLVGAIAYKF
ncbi:MAG TPA: DUF481 domain-containing protein [Verrucomicrobiae bacterium]|nr:DUF481 domain-containing protein [Verrucomicrobiae bacterium]